VSQSDHTKRVWAQNVSWFLNVNLGGAWSHHCAVSRHNGDCCYCVLHARPPTHTCSKRTPVLERYGQIVLSASRLKAGGCFIYHQV